MLEQKVANGTVHELPPDLHQALIVKSTALANWQNITPLARNEFICWVENAKHDETRTRRVRRTVEELLDGQKRPCCWVGCIHRTDKKPSKWQKDVLINKRPRTNPDHTATASPR